MNNDNFTPMFEIELLAGVTGKQGDKGDKGDTGEQGIQGIQGLTGETGATGNGIASVEQTTTSHVSSGVNVWTLTDTNGTTYDFSVENGEKGDKGETGVCNNVAFNTVAEMKAATNLEDGMVAQTLGYYAANDGGGAIYKVVDDNTLTADDGSVHDLANDLKAVLIICETTNAKQFGAKGNGVYDDTSSVTNYVSKCIELNKPINLTEGEYQLTQTIRVNQYNKINIYGNVVINTTASVGITISNISVDESIEDNRFLNSEIINTKNGNLVIIGNDTNIGIAIGTDSSSSISYLNSYAFTNIGNVKISNFDIGIQLYLNRLYLNSFNNVIINKCRIGINSSSYTIDSGENIAFNHCIISGCDICVNFKELGIDLIFNNCSFDFFGILLYVNPSSFKYSNVVFNSCHVEGLGVSSNVDPVVYNNKGLIINNSTADPVNVEFNSSHCNFSSNEISYENIFSGFINLNIEMIFYYTFGLNSTPLSTKKLCDDYVRINKNNAFWTYQWCFIPLTNKINLYRNYNFELNQVGQTNGDMNINNILKFLGKSGVLTLSIASDDTYTKALKIECSSSSDTGVYANVEFGKFLMKSGQRIESSLMYKTNVNSEKNLVIPIYYDYYDINDNLIGSTPSSNKPQANKTKYLHSSSYVRPGVGMFDIAPVGTYYCIPKLQFNGNMDSTEYVYISNIFINIL